MKNIRATVRKIIRQSESFRPVKRLELPGLINFWTRRSRSGDSWTHVWVFAGVDLEPVKNALSQVIELGGSSFDSPYDCTGRPFSNPCEFYVQQDRIFVTQWGGLDV